jgi:hypothetical protein
MLIFRLKTMDDIREIKIGGVVSIFSRFYNNKTRLCLDRFVKNGHEHAKKLLLQCNLPK